MDNFQKGPVNTGYFCSSSKGGKPVSGNMFQTAQREIESFCNSSINYECARCDSSDPAVALTIDSELAGITIIFLFHRIICETRGMISSLLSVTDKLESSEVMLIDLR